MEDEPRVCSGCQHKPFGLIQLGNSVVNRSLPRVHLAGTLPGDFGFLWFGLLDTAGNLDNSGESGMFIMIRLCPLEINGIS